MNGIPTFPRNVALHLSIQRCLQYGPRRSPEMMSGQWSGIDDVNPPINAAFRVAIDRYKEVLAYAMSSSAYLRLRPEIIRLPQNLAREEYIYLGEKLAENLE